MHKEETSKEITTQPTTTNEALEPSELAPCPFCPTTRRETYNTEGGIVGVIIHEAVCFFAAPERRQILTPRGVGKWNSRVTAPIVAPDGISWSALLSVLERLKSKTRNPDAEWYHGWNAAIQCLINDINARSAAPASTVAPVCPEPD